MRHITNSRFIFLCTVLVLGNACQKPEDPKRFQGSTSTQRIEGLVESLKEAPKETQASRTKYLNSGFLELYQTYAEGLSNRSITIDGITFSQLRSELEQAEGLFADLNGTYSTIGAQMHELGVDAGQNLSAAELKDSLQSAADFFEETGEWAAWKQLIIAGSTARATDGSSLHLATLNPVFRLQNDEVSPEECVYVYENISHSAWALSTAANFFNTANEMPEGMLEKCVYKDPAGKAGPTCKEQTFAAAAAVQITAQKAMEASTNFKNQCEEHNYPTKPSAP